MKENGRVVQNNCERAQFEAFLKRVSNAHGFELKKHKPAVENALQERYAFSYDRKHVSIVYETNSGTLVITAPEYVLSILKAELDVVKLDIIKAEPVINIAAGSNNLPKMPENKPLTNGRPVINVVIKPESEPVKQSFLQNGNNNNAVPTPVKKPVEQNFLQNGNNNNIAKKEPFSPTLAEAGFERKNQNEIRKQPETENKRQVEERKKLKPEHKSQEAKQKQLEAERKRQEEKLKSDEKRKKAEDEKRKKIEEEHKKAEEERKKQEELLRIDEERKKLDELYKNGYAIKKYQPERLDKVLKNIKLLKGVSCRLTGNESGSRTYIIGDKRNKVYLRYIDSKNTLQLQGKRSKLFGEIQVLVSEDSDYVTAVSSHIDLTGEEKRARDMEKLLKKLMPAAFDFLSEQSRIDLTIGMIDIGNDEVRLSDYSMLLVPPYRGLERLIYDLQRAKGIEVKMIGQAYEKLDGIYTLKVGYKRKINSIVYAEVMSALYTEYFAKRNFYAHSDITGDLLSRVITEKSAVKEIFNNLTRIIEYNIVKLKETGFNTNIFLK